MSFQFNADAIEDNGSQDWQPIPEGVTRPRLKMWKRSRARTRPLTPTGKWCLKLSLASMPARRSTTTSSKRKKGYKRAKLIFSRLGLDMTGNVDVKKADIMGKHVLVNVEIEECEFEGKKFLNNKIPFAGYQPLTEPQTAAEIHGDDDLPQF